MSAIVSFRFAGSRVDAEVVAKALAPLGELRQNSKRKPYWAISSTLENDETLEAHLLSLLEQLMPFEAKIRQLASQFQEPGFLCTLAADENGSSLNVNLSYDTIQLIGRLQADLLMSFMP